MDGFKARLNESVQFRLSLALSLAILGVAVVAGLFSFFSAFDEAHELQDDVLRQVAVLVQRQVLPPGPAGRARDADEEARVIVQPLGPARAAAPGPGPDAGGAIDLPATLPDGLQTVTADGETFRVLVKTLDSGQRMAVAQEVGLRDEIARDSALRTVMPFLVLVPLLLVIVARLVRQMFRPIEALSREVDQRAEQELHPLEEGRLPVEVRPFVVAINRLLLRVSRSMEEQRRFVADAAHELRSPLTALSLQAERLAQADLPEVARERLATLRQGIERGRSLLDQLLALARAQSAADEPPARVSVLAVYRRVLADLLPLAEAKDIDIGIEGEQDAEVAAGETELFSVVRNLVDNAIRYSPAGGRVDLSLQASGGCAELAIRDTGPGIPPAERERVFAPFYRTLGSDQVGSGLGLAIVKAIADRLGAEVRLDFADPARRSGLRVVLRIPQRPHADRPDGTAA